MRRWVTTMQSNLRRHELCSTHVSLIHARRHYLHTQIPREHRTETEQSRFICRPVYPSVSDASSKHVLCDRRSPNDRGIWSDHYIIARILNYEGIEPARAQAVKCKIAPVEVIDMKCTLSTYMMQCYTLPSTSHSDSCSNSRGISHSDLHSAVDHRVISSQRRAICACRDV